MSDYDSDGSEAVGARRRTQQPLFNKDASRSPSVAPAPRRIARFIGDDDDEPVSLLPPKKRSRASTTTAAASRAAEDDLFDGLDDLTNDAPTLGRIDTANFARLLEQSNANAAADAAAMEDDPSKLDEDVGALAPKKKRVVAKMDDNRLMGPNGFPKLIVAAKKFKVGPKGSEMKDLKKLMTMYQLWAHEMFPKTNLRDTLTTVEKLCHKNTLRRALREYRDEERADKLPPKPEGADDDDGIEAEIEAAEAEAQAQKAKEAAAKAKAREMEIEDDFDDLDAEAEAMLRELEGTTEKQKEPAAPRKRLVLEAEDGFDEDEAAMLAELEMEGYGASVPTSKKSADERKDDTTADANGFDDDEMAMLAELEMGSTAATPPPPPAKKKLVLEEDFDEEAERMMAELENEGAGESSTFAAPSKSIVVEDDELGFDDIDADMEAAMLELESGKKGDEKVVEQGKGVPEDGLSAEEEAVLAAMEA
ncbi:hypothetical protein MNV49_003795 [Pseudohyphozyma bogoriensis]|nr:hypothetical protein MNV49_003795 [Pseudohyphozyma bogoriensis]